MLLKFCFSKTMVKYNLNPGAFFAIEVTLITDSNLTIIAFTSQLSLFTQ
jgi:hypothetical protein